MADIVTPRIESISEPHTGPHDQPAPKQNAKGAAAGKTSPLSVPQIGTPEEEDKHKLDEMA
jgi:hypothetical protein